MNERINKKKVMYHFLNHVTEIVLILVVIALWISTDSFMKLNNWMNLLSFRRHQGPDRAGRHHGSDLR